MKLHKPYKQPKQQIVRSLSYPHRTHTARNITPTKTPGNLAGLKFIVIATLIGVAVFAFGSPMKSDDTKSANSSESPPGVTKPVTPTKIDFSSMNTAITDEISKYPNMDIGISIIDINTGETQQYGVQVPFVAASTAKLLTATAFLREVESGETTLSQTVSGRPAEDALRAMIVESDNTVWHELNDYVLTDAKLNQVANLSGLTNYDPVENTIIPTDVAKLLSNLYQEKLINHDHTELLLSFMSQAKDIDYVTDTVPAGIKVFHKPGYLADRVHDAVIIDNGKRPYALVIFSKARYGGYNRIQGEILFKNVTQATLNTFNTKLQ